jgi:hypothetical protein
MRARATTTLAALLALTFAASVPAVAGDELGQSTLDLDPYDFAFKKEYSLGVRRHNLTSAQRVVGWQLSDHWYFGKHRGDDDGFGLIWQTNATQVALTNEGVVFRRQL